MIPSILSQFVSTIKETTLGYVINVPELTFAAGQINNRLLTQPFEVYFILAIIYFVVCWTLTQLSNGLERWIAWRRSGAANAAVIAAAHAVAAES
jgi:polar amino acid transport system permease protein